MAEIHPVKLEATKQIEKKCMTSFITKILELFYPFTTVHNLLYTEWFGVNKVNLNTRRTRSDIIINISM